MGEEVNAWLDKASAILERGFSNDNTCPKCLKPTLKYDKDMKKISCSNCGFTVALRVEE